MNKKKNRIVILLIICSLLFSGYQAVPIFAADADTSSPQEGYQPENATPKKEFKSLLSMVDMPKILLIEDVNPWSVTRHITMLYQIGDVEKISSSAAIATDFQKYDIIILSDDQNNDAYQNYSKFKGKLEQYAEKGGTVIFGACDQGWNGGYLTENLPGEVVKVHNYQNRNVISDANHPIVTGELTDQVPLNNSLLYGSYCSHTGFLESTLPAGSTIILRDQSGNPTLVEYPLGKGTVLASGLTWEHNLDYNYNFSKSLKNLYAYAVYCATKDFCFQLSSAAGAVGDYVDITVSMKNNPGISGISFELGFDKVYFEPVSITASGAAVTPVFSNLTGNGDISKMDSITAVWSNASNVTKSSSDLFTVRFKIKENAYMGDYPITLAGMVVNELFEDVEYCVRQGSISVMNGLEVLYGDIYTDGSIDIKDAVKLAQFLSEKIQLNTYETLASDVKKDSQIDVRDAIKLSQYLAGYDNIKLGSAN